MYLGKVENGCCVTFEIVLAGEMAERLKAHAWKACLGETLTWVRIPLSPPALSVALSLNNLIVPQIFDLPMPRV